MNRKRSYLLDTNILIWLSSKTSRIPSATLRILENYDAELWTSSAAFWELTIKQSVGKMQGELRFDRLLDSYAIQELPISSKYMDTLRDLPLIHGDPFDRIMIAQAITEGMTFVTGDRTLAQYPVSQMQI